MLSAAAAVKTQRVVRLRADVLNEFPERLEPAFLGVGVECRPPWRASADGDVCPWKLPAPCRDLCRISCRRVEPILSEWGLSSTGEDGKPTAGVEVGRIERALPLLSRIRENVHYEVPCGPGAVVVT